MRTDTEMRHYRPWAGLVARVVGRVVQARDVNVALATPDGVGKPSRIKPNTFRCLRKALNR
jgi:hypothetical protein